jgi:hypothetical protein
MPNEPISSTELMDNLAEVEGGDGILTIRSHENCRGWNGIRYKNRYVCQECWF